MSSEKKKNVCRMNIKQEWTQIGSLGVVQLDDLGSANDNYCFQPL